MQSKGFSISNSTKLLLDDSDNDLLQEIIRIFGNIAKFHTNDIYNYIKSLCLFCIKDSYGPNLERSMLTGLVSTKHVIQYKKSVGYVIALNAKVVSALINKSRNFLQLYLSNDCIFEKISAEEVTNILSDNQTQKRKITMICKLLNESGITTDFYFFKRRYLKSDNQNIDNLLNTLSKKLNISTEVGNKKSLPNNHRFLKTFQEIRTLKKSVSDYKKRVDELEKQLHDSDEPKPKNEKVLMTDRIAKFLNDQFVHKPFSHWNDNLIKDAFLVKYCSSSAYNRLVTLSHNNLPPPSTVESHFHKPLANLHDCLTNHDKIGILLDSYYEDNKKLVPNETIECCISSDAASLINFEEYNYIEEEEMEEEEEEASNEEEEEQKENKSKKKRKENVIKNQIINEILNGDKVNNQNFSIDKHKELSDNEVKFFFAYIMQPLDWRLPVIAIYLSKSLTGHPVLNDIKDIQLIASSVNSHTNFNCRFWAADGELALSSFHKLAFNRYKSNINKVIRGQMTINDFINDVFSKLKILPILDMFHGTKSGRNKVVSNDIKLGDNLDIINSNDLAEELNLHGNVLNDKSTTGRMKDHYALELFTIENAMKEFELGKKSSGFYIFIYSLVIEIFRNCYFHIDLRITLSDLCLYIFLLLIQNSNKFPSETKYRKNKRSKARYVWFNDKISIIKFFNTIISVCYCLRHPEIQKYLGIERLSSRACEQYFGQFRNHYRGNETAITAFSYAVRSALSFQLQFDLGVFIKISKRENFGGCHLNFVSNVSNYLYNQNIGTNFTLNDIRKIAINIFTTATKSSSQWSCETQVFIEELYTLIQKFPSTPKQKFSLSKGGKILPQIIATHTKKKETIYPLLPKAYIVQNEIKKTENELLHYKQVLNILIKEYNKNTNDAPKYNDCLSIISKNKELAKESNKSNLLQNQHKILNIQFLPYYTQLLKKSQSLEPILYQGIKNWKDHIRNKAAEEHMQNTDFQSSCCKVKNNINSQSSNNEMVNLIDKIVNEPNTFYDMNRYVSNPELEHDNFKKRNAWSNDEINVFIESYAKYPKKFKKIADELPSKKVNDVIEFYYLHKKDLNLKQYNIKAKKRCKYVYKKLNIMEKEQ